MDIGQHEPETIYSGNIPKGHFWNIVRKWSKELSLNYSACEWSIFDVKPIVNETPGTSSILFGIFAEWELGALLGNTFPIFAIYYCSFMFSTIWTYFSALFQDFSMGTVLLMMGVGGSLYKLRRINRERPTRERASTRLIFSQTSLFLLIDVMHLRSVDPISICFQSSS